MKKFICLLLLSFSSTQIFTSESNSESNEEIEDNASYQAHQWIEDMCPEFFVTMYPGWYGNEDEDAVQEGINSLKKGEYAKVNEECPYKDLKIKVDQPAGQVEEDFSVYKFVDKELHVIIDSLFADDDKKNSLLIRGLNKSRIIKLFVINGIRRHEDLKVIELKFNSHVIPKYNFLVKLNNGSEFYLRRFDCILEEKQEQRYWKAVDNSFKEEIVRYYFSHL